MERAVLVARHGRVLSCTLNRPRSLNALTLEMVRELRGVLGAFATDAHCRVLVLRGAGGKAFCAGGDMKALAQDARAGGALARSFFAEEYNLNAAIAELDRPQVSVWDGIVMGGGAGLSVHGRFRVATERTLFAMPEGAIGFFPDVGASRFLNDLPGNAGTYLALSGARIGASDACALGLATHFVPASRVGVGELEDALANCATESEVDARLRDLAAGAQPPAPADGAQPLAPHRGAIERCFGQGSVSAIVRALDGERSEWAVQASRALRRQSPTSLVLTLHLLRQGAREPLRECLAREYTLAALLTAPPAATGPASDFFEGVRAVLVDKDQRPACHPPTLEQLYD